MTISKKTKKIALKKKVFFFYLSEVSVFTIFSFFSGMSLETIQFFQPSTNNIAIIIK